MEFHIPLGAWAMLFLCSSTRTFKVNVWPFPKATVPLVSWAYTPNEQISLRSIFGDADAILTCNDFYGSVDSGNCDLALSFNMVVFGVYHRNQRVNDLVAWNVV